jgi:tetratricopeptide (TPR) repeat protein
MSAYSFISTACFGLLLALTACSSVTSQVQAGRLALQTGRPDEAIVLLTQAAEHDPDYQLPYRVRESVFTYLGRAYYETGRDAEARRALEQAIARDKDDPLARLYLGLVLARNGEHARGEKEIEAGLGNIDEALEYIATDSVYGYHWDPAMRIRSAIRTTFAARNGLMEFAASAQHIGALFDEEIDKARRDEARNRYGRGGGGGD